MWSYKLHNKKHNTNSTTTTLFLSSLSCAPFSFMYDPWCTAHPGPAGGIGSFVRGFPSTCQLPVLLPVAGRRSHIISVCLYCMAVIRPYAAYCLYGSAVSCVHRLSLRHAPVVVCMGWCVVLGQLVWGDLPSCLCFAS